MKPQYLGIEIGGTKLQLGIGESAGKPLKVCKRLRIDPSHGAEGILRQILEHGRELLVQSSVAAIGVGFGGPVCVEDERAQHSNQISGWSNFPICDWLRNAFGRPAALMNDCDAAALAEASAGAGKKFKSVFFLTVGSGIGGGFVIDRRLHGSTRPAVAEIGQMRFPLGNPPRLRSVESMASGWGIAERARQILRSLSSAANGPSPDSNPSAVESPLASIADRDFQSSLTEKWQENSFPNLRAMASVSQLLDSRKEEIDGLNTMDIGIAAAQGDPFACWLFDTALQVLGCAIAQMICLLAPEVVIIGGGVSRLNDDLFWNPLRGYVDRSVFSPLRESYAIGPAAFGDDVVVHGALEAARSHFAAVK
jgi:glucokinase